MARPTFLLLTTAGALGGITTGAPGQAVDTSLLASPPAEQVRCVTAQRASRPGQQAPLRLHRYHIGRPAFQLRIPAGQTLMTGPPPRVTIAVFDPRGRPVALVDSVFVSWTTWVTTVEFDSSSRRQSYLQSSTVDSAAAMAIAMRLGATRLMEAGDSAERLRTVGPRQSLDSNAVRRARDLAAFLWLLRCP